jgi:hypothetical protein
MEFLKFDQTGAMPYFKSGWANMVNNCNGFLAVNTGDEIVRVNDHVLYPGVPGTNNGDTYPFFGHSGEIFSGTIKIAFGTGGGGNPAVTIDQKFYVFPNGEVK